MPLSPLPPLLPLAVLRAGRTRPVEETRQPFQSALDFLLSHCYNNYIMNQAITVSPKTIEEILVRLDRLAKEVKAIKARLFEEEPPYGSDEWWEWSERKADEDIKKGKLMRFNSAEEAIKWLNK